MRCTRRVLFCVAGAALPIFGEAEANSLLLMTPAEAARIKASLPKADAEALRRQSAREQQRGPWSVTTDRPAHQPKVPVNDYYSEGPYWWPDPKNPGGPYIRRDGETNPEHFVKNRRALGDMATAVLTLGMAAYFLDDRPAAAHASRVLSTWFLDAKTRMSPHLEYGQAIPGRNDGRGAGIIDTASLIQTVQGITLLRAAGGIDEATLAGLQRWFGDYLRWLTTSKKGVAEQHSGNNHATWWTAQVAAYATLAGDKAAQQMAFQWFRETLLPGQIRQNGSAPREEERTKSLSYTTFNLDAFSLLCRIAQVAGTDLWHFRAPNTGVTIATAVSYAMPFVLQPAQWKEKQIADFTAGKLVFPAYAAAALDDKEVRREYASLRRDHSSAWAMLSDWIAASAVPRTSLETH